MAMLIHIVLTLVACVSAMTLAVCFPVLLAGSEKPIKLLRPLFPESWTELIIYLRKDSGFALGYVRFRG